MENEPPARRPSHTEVEKSDPAQGIRRAMSLLTILFWPSIGRFIIFFDIFGNNDIFVCFPKPRRHLLGDTKQDLVGQGGHPGIQNSYGDKEQYRGL